MEENPVPDLFCSEILSDLDDITSYYLEQLKSDASSFDNAPIEGDSQNVPEYEPSLLETWVEIWQPHTDPEPLKYPPSYDFSTESTESSLVDELSPVSSEETYKATEGFDGNQFICLGEAVETTTPSTSQDWSLEYLLSETSGTSDIKQDRHSEDRHAVFSTKEPEIDLNSFAENAELREQSTSSGVVHVHNNLDEDDCEDDPTTVQVDAGNADSINSLVPDTDATNSVEEDIRQSSEEPVEEPEEDIDSASSSCATNAQVVPNLLTMLLSHKTETDYENEDEDDSDMELHFHESPFSPLNSASDSQVVPLWDQEE